MILGTILIAGGAVLIAIFGIVPEPTRSLEDLLVLFNRPAFVIYFTLLGFSLGVALLVVSDVRFQIFGPVFTGNNPLDPHLRMDLFTAHQNYALFATFDPCLAPAHSEPYHHNRPYHDGDNASDGEEIEL